MSVSPGLTYAEKRVFKINRLLRGLESLNDLGPRDIPKGFSLTGGYSLEDITRNDYSRYKQRIAPNFEVISLLEPPCMESDQAQRFQLRTIQFLQS